MIVPDASAAVLLFTNPSDYRTANAKNRLAFDPAWIVPEHWHTEMLSAIRGMYLGSKLAPADADRAVAALARMVVGTTAVAPLLPRMWELRSNLSAYDAAYVATAESQGLTLVTADARIARSGAARCKIETIA